MEQSTRGLVKRTNYNGFHSLLRLCLYTQTVKIITKHEKLTYNMVGWHSFKQSMYWCKGAIGLLVLNNADLFQEIYM